MSDSAARNSGDLEFIDTNILLYAHDDTEPRRFTRANALIETAWARGSGATSIQVLQEFYVNAVKLPTPVDAATAESFVREYARWPTHCPTSDDVLAAINLHRTHQVSFWDAMIVRSAAELGCATLWTEDLQHGQMIGGVRVTNPFVDQ